MTIPFLSNLSATTRLARIQGEAGEPVFGDNPQVKIRLEGSRDALRAASDAIYKFAQKNKLHIDTNLVSSGSSAHMDYHLNVHIHTDPNEPSALVEALEKVRKATQCQLDAHVKACVIPFTDEGTLNFIPSATIRVTHPDKTTTHTIRGYLAKQLDDEYRGQHHHLGRIGSLDFPAEFEHNGTCEILGDGGPSDTLYLTYRGAVTEDKKIAHQRSYAIGERLSNILGIAELGPDNKRIGTAMG